MSIDEFSHKLGSLEAKQESLTKTVQNHYTVSNEKLDKIIDKLTMMNGSIAKAHDRLDINEEKIKKNTEACNDWKSSKKTAKTIIGLSALGGSAGGFGISNIITKLFG